MPIKFSTVLLFFFCGSFLNARSIAQTPTKSVTPETTPVQSRKIKKETEFQMTSGGKFKVPKGWKATDQNGNFVLSDPDNEITAAIVEDRKSGGEDAIRSAWKTVLPQHSKEINDAALDGTSSRNRGDWDEIIHVAYQLKPEDGPLAFANARKKGHVCYVFLAYGSKAAIDRRGAQLSLIYDSLTLPGFIGNAFKGMNAYSLDDDRAKTLENFIERARNKCKIPGVAVAVVQNGQVVYEKGFGVCEKGKASKVTPQTLFMIGSTTKPLSSLLLARLVDAHKFDWNTPVVKLMHGFHLRDPKITREVTMKDTFCACVGLPREDTELLFDTAKGTPEGLFDRIGKLAPTTGFGETFQYSNQMVAVGGYIAAHALYPQKNLGQAYDQAMQSQVFDPLGMKDSTLDVDTVIQKDHATPHRFAFNGEFVPVLLSVEKWISPVRPAMGVWSNVDDMTKYLLVELSKGKKIDGSEYVSEKNLLKRREPQVEISSEASYGLGLFLNDKHGLTYIGHDGSVAGFSSLMAMYPDQSVGIVVLANASRSELFTNAVRARLFEILFDKNLKAEDDLNDAIGKMQRLEAIVNFHSFFNDQGFFKKLQGDYWNEDLGHVSIKLENGKAFFVTDEWTVQLARYERVFKDGRKEDNWIILTEAPASKIQLKVDNENNNMTLTLEEPQKKYVFKKVP